MRLDLIQLPNAPELPNADRGKLALANRTTGGEGCARWTNAARAVGWGDVPKTSWSLPGFPRGPIPDQKIKPEITADLDELVGRVEL